MLLQLLEMLQPPGELEQTTNMSHILNVNTFLHLNMHFGTIDETGIVVLPFLNKF